MADDRWFRVFYAPPRRSMDVKAEDSVEAADKVAGLVFEADILDVQELPQDGEALTSGT